MEKDIYTILIEAFKEQETEQDKAYFCDEIGRILRNFEREVKK